MEYDLKKLDKLAKKTLSAKRYYHTQCVVQQAQKLARLYGCDEQKAMVAGWMHDICKEIPREEQLQWLTKCGIILDSVQESQPKTWHGMAACGFISEKLGITDPEILHAIRFHTTACGHMTELDEVVYLADLDECRPRLSRHPADAETRGNRPQARDEGSDALRGQRPRGAVARNQL